MTKFKVLDTDKAMTQDEIGQFILDEARRISTKYSYQYGVDADEMESFMVTEIFIEVSKKPSMGNIKGIRYIANIRSVDYIREIAKQNGELSFSSLGSESDEDGFIEYPIASDSNTSETVIKSDELSSFLDSLSERERKIVELSAGITDSLSNVEKAKVKELIDLKGEGAWLNTSDIGIILGLSRRQVQYPFLSENLKDKALDFGLWF